VIEVVLRQQCPSFGRASSALVEVEVEVMMSRPYN